ncbi:MAG: Flp pilus assembly protein TadG [Pirellulaceae bacterium]|jgi:Flp pilus assembly protein TadG
MMTPRKMKSVQRRRRGMTLSIELVMILPILTILTVGIIEFSIIMLSSQAISTAAHLGTREAALPSADYDTVADAVSDALRTKIWEGQHEVVIFVTDATTMMTLKDDGTPGADIQLEDANTGDQISVTVTVPTNQAAPDILSIIGLSTSGSELTTTFVTRRE